MSQLTHIFVTVPEGREVPVPSGDATAPGGLLLRCLPKHPETGKGLVWRLPYSGYTRKRLNVGDFNLSNISGTKVAELEKAAALADPEAYETDALGSVTGLAKKPAPATTAPATTTKG